MSDRADQSVTDSCIKGTKSLRTKEGMEDLLAMFAKQDEMIEMRLAMGWLRELPNGKIVDAGLPRGGARPGAGRKKIYASNAERQRAWRERSKQGEL